MIESLVEGISVSDSSSQLDVIESGVDSIAECCASSSDVLGDLTDIGSCLDSTIDVPDDINNLTLTVISLLKTILLDLREKMIKSIPQCLIVLFETNAYVKGE